MEGVEGLLVELYEGQDASRKAAVSGELMRRRSLQGAWREFVAWLEGTEDLSSHLYVAYYCASGLEEAVKKDWDGPECRAVVGRCLMGGPRGVLTGGATGARPEVPAAVRTRLCKVYVEIGAKAWPEEVPGFLDEVLALCCAENQRTSSLGVDVLRICCEEFCHNNSVDALRRRSLKQNVTAAVPGIVRVVIGLINSPSLESRAVCSALEAAIILTEKTPNGAAELTRGGGDAFFQSLFQRIHVELEKCDDCQPGGPASRAAGLLEAVLARKLVPPDAQSFALNVGRGVVRCVRALTLVLERNGADALDEDFVADVCELVATFADQHLARVLTTDTAGAFLDALASLTVAVDARGLRRVLRPWETLVDVIKSGEDAADPSMAVSLASAAGPGLASLLERLLATRLLVTVDDGLRDLSDEVPIAVSGTAIGKHEHTPDDDVDLDRLIEDMAGGAPDPRHVPGADVGDDLSLLLTDGLDLVANCCSCVFLRQAVADRVARTALTHAEATIRQALTPHIQQQPPQPLSAQPAADVSDRDAARDAATMLYALAASALHAENATLQQATELSASAARALIQGRAHGRSSTLADVETASLDACRDLLPALAWRGGEIQKPASDALTAASGALDASVSPAPEHVQRAASWVVLAVAKSPNLAPNLASLADPGASIIAAQHASSKCRALIYRAAAAVAVAVAFVDGENSQLGPDAAARASLDVRVCAPLAGPILEAFRKIAGDPLGNLSSAPVERSLLDACHRSARGLAALAAGFARDDASSKQGAGPGGGKKAVRSLLTDQGTHMSKCLEAAPGLLAYCAARALKTVDPSQASSPMAVRAAASARQPHLNAAASVVDFLLAVSRATGHDPGGAAALNAVGALLAAFELASPAAAFEPSPLSRSSTTTTSGGSRSRQTTTTAVLGAAPPRAAAAYLVKATCRLAAAAASDSDVKKPAVAQICALCSEHVAPVAADPTVAADLLPAILEVYHRLLVHQWSYFTTFTESGTPPRRVKLVRPEAAQHLDDVFAAVELAVKGHDLPAACVKKGLVILDALHATHRALDLPQLAETWRPRFAAALLDAVLDKRHDLLVDDLAASLQSLVPDALYHAFLAEFLPAHLHARLLNASHQPLVDPVNLVQRAAFPPHRPDHLAFATALKDLAHDLHLLHSRTNHDHSVHDNVLAAF